MGADELEYQMSGNEHDKGLSPKIRTPDDLNNERLRLENENLRLKLQLAGLSMTQVTGNRFDPKVPLIVDGLPVPQAPARWVPPEADPNPAGLKLASPVTPDAVIAPSGEVQAPAALAPSRQELKLDLACGQTPQPGFEGVDLLAPGAQHKVDLMKFPWPWADNSVDELFCSHFVEHIEARCVEERDLSSRAPVPPVSIDGLTPEAYGEALKAHEALIARFVGQDMFFAFFDEAYRVLKPGGHMKVICPAARSNRGFQDPTHRRFIVLETFMYLLKEFRDVNKLDHYRVRCDFAGEVVPTTSQELALFSPEVQARMFERDWNVVYDWHATLISKKKEGE